MAFLRQGLSNRSTACVQWAPTRTVHDPNPPITLESPSGGDTYDVSSTEAASASDASGSSAILVDSRTEAASASDASGSSAIIVDSATEAASASETSSGAEDSGGGGGGVLMLLGVGGTGGGVEEAVTGAPTGIVLSAGLFPAAVKIDAVAMPANATWMEFRAKPTADAAWSGWSVVSGDSYARSRFVASNAPMDVELRGANSLGAGPASAVANVTSLKSVLVWGMIGQSNTDGWAAVTQDPAHLDVDDAILLLTAEEAAARNDIKCTNHVTGSEALVELGIGSTSTKTYTTGAFGIPIGTPGIGPEIGIVDHLLDEEYPFLPTAGSTTTQMPNAICKTSQGGTSLDEWRHGGTSYARLQTVFRTFVGARLAAGYKLFWQGVYFNQGNADSPDWTPTWVARLVDFKDFLEEQFELENVHFGVAKLYDNGPIDEEFNEAVATLPGLDSRIFTISAPTTTVGDDIHNDVPADRITGNEFVESSQALMKRSADFIAEGAPCIGVHPAFGRKPTLITDAGGTSVVIGMTVTESVTVYWAVYAAGTPAPSASAVKAGTGAQSAGSAAVTIDVEADVTVTGLTAAVSHEVFFMAEISTSNRSKVRQLSLVRPVVVLTENSQIASSGGATQTFNVGSNIAGTLYGVLYAPAQARPHTLDLESPGTWALFKASVAVSAAGTGDLVFTGLTVSESYVLWYGLKTAGGQWSPLGETAFDADPPVGVPGAITDLTAVALSESTVQLAFTPPSGSPTSYEYSLNSGADWLTAAGDLIVTGLAQTTSNNFMARGVNGFGPGDDSNEVTAVTQFYDAFTRADGNVETGAAWWTRTTGAAGDIVVSGNRLASVVNQNSLVRLTHNFGAVNQFVQAAWITTTNLGGKYLVARCTNTNNFVGVRRLANVYELVHRVASVTTALGSVAVVGSGDVLRLDIDVAGDLARLWLNGSVAVDWVATDATLDGSFVGVVNSGSPTTLDPWLDDFRSGLL